MTSLPAALHALQLYVCRAVARILTEAGITTQEATALLREGMEGLGLPTTAAQGDRVQARAHTFSGQLEVQAVLPGVTQHMLREACLMVADTGGWLSRGGRQGSGLAYFCTHCFCVDTLAGSLLLL
jgi:hypothetical protein